MNARRSLAIALLFLAVLLLALPPAPSAAAAAPAGSFDPAALDAAITAQLRKHGLPGAVVAVTDGQQIVYAQGYDTAGQGRALSPQTPMYIGSQTKSLTALALARLADRGLVDLSAPVQTYLPWFTVADADAARHITLRHLLLHTSGLSEAGYTTILSPSATQEEAVRSLASARLTAPVGQRHQYFNMGYVVLAQVIEQVTGRPYAEVLREEVFRPLGMAHTYTDPQAARAAGLAQGYSRFFGFAVPARQPHPTYELAAGYVISTAEDLTRLANFVLQRGAGPGEALLSPEMMRQLLAPYQGYAMGWNVSPGHIYHGGANETFKTFVDVYPQRDLGIVLLINQGYMLDHYISAEQVFAAAEAVVLGRPVPPVAGGPSVRALGWGLLAVTLFVAAIEVHGFCRLRGWPARAAAMSPARRWFEVAISFIIPTVILIVVFSQI